MSQTTRHDRSKMDFSDIDNLGRATESFMREQRKALGHRGVNVTEIVHQCKRSMVFVVLGVIFVTALVCGIRFAYNDSAMRDPQQTQTQTEEDAQVSMPTTGASSTDVIKQEAEVGGTTPTTASAVQTHVSTTPTTFLDDDEIATTPILTADSVLQTEDTTDVQTTVSSKETTTGTSKTAASTTSTTKKSTAVSSKATTTTTGRTAATSTTTTTTTKPVTTTTTTTTNAAAAKLQYFNPHVADVTKNGDVYTQTVNVQVYNSGTAACRSLTIRLSCPSEGKFVSVKDALYSSRISYSGSTITVYYSEQIPVNSFAQLKLTVQSTQPLTTCSVVS